MSDKSSNCAQRYEPRSPLWFPVLHLMRRAGPSPLGGKVSAKLGGWDRVAAERLQEFVLMCHSLSFPASVWAVSGPSKLLAVSGNNMSWKQSTASERVGSLNMHTCLQLWPISFHVCVCFKYLYHKYVDTFSGVLICRAGFKIWRVKKDMPCTHVSWAKPLIPELNGILSTWVVLLRLMRQPIVRPKRDRKEIWQGNWRVVKAATLQPSVKLILLLSKLYHDRTCFRPRLTPAATTVEMGSTWRVQWALAFEAISSHQSGQALGLSSNAEFCVSRIWSRLHQELVWGSGWGQQQKRLKGGSAWRVQSLAATRQDKCGFIHSFIIYFHLFSVDSLQNDCLSDPKIFSGFNDEYMWFLNAPANTQSVNDYFSSVPTEACVIVKCAHLLHSKVINDRAVISTRIVQSIFPMQPFVEPPAL